MESRNNTVSPQPGTVTPQSSGGIRRHHTISSSSRVSRTGSKLIDDEQPVWNGNEDEVVDNDWVGGIGPVGDKSTSLHRQTSLPTRHLQRGKSLLNTQIYPPSDDLADHLIALRTQPGGTLTPRTLNSLSAITGHEGEEEDWEREISDFRGDDEVSTAALPPNPPWSSHFSSRQAHTWYPSIATCSDKTVLPIPTGLSICFHPHELHRDDQVVFFLEVKRLCVSCDRDLFFFSHSLLLISAMD